MGTALWIAGEEFLISDVDTTDAGEILGDGWISDGIAGGCRHDWAQLMDHDRASAEWRTVSEVCQECGDVRRPPVFPTGPSKITLTIVDGPDPGLFDGFRTWRPRS